MPTGLFRQILYKQDDGGGEGGSFIPPAIINIFVLVISAVILILLKLPFINALSAKKGYFFEFNSYFYFISAFFVLNLVFLFIPLMKKFNCLINLTLIIADGYTLAEMLYRWHPISITQTSLSFLGEQEIFHLNGFFLHRLFQIIPLIMGVLMFFAYGRGYFENYLKFGDLSVDTFILNKNQAQKWRWILIKFLLWLSGLTIFIFLVQTNKTKGYFPLFMLLPIFLYSFWNCLVEEVLFRGLLLSVSSKAMKAEIANILQAVLFGLIHFSPMDINMSLIKVVLFAYLGWFFGKATMETKGIGASYLMHSLLVVGIEIRVLMQ